MFVLQIDTAASLVSEVAFPIAAFLLVYKMYREEREYVRSEHRDAREEREAWIATVNELQNTVEKQTRIVAGLEEQIEARQKLDRVLHDRERREDSAEDDS